MYLYVRSFSSSQITRIDDDAFSVLVLLHTCKIDPFGILWDVRVQGCIYGFLIILRTNRLKWNFSTPRNILIYIYRAWIYFCHPLFFSYVRFANFEYLLRGKLSAKSYYRMRMKSSSEKVGSAGGPSPFFSCLSYVQGYIVKRCWKLYTQIYMYYIHYIRVCAEAEVPV